MRRENVKNFLSGGRELDADAVLGMAALQVVIAAVDIVWGNNPIIAAVSLSPFLLAAIILFIVFRVKIHGVRRKRERLKYINLYFGIEGLLASLACQCASLTFVKITGATLVAAICALLLANGLVVLGMVFLVCRMINGKKKFSPATGGVSVGAIAAAASFGVLLSNHVEPEFHDVMMCFAFAALSLIFSVFVVFIQKYYYYHLTERLENAEAEREEKQK